MQGIASERRAQQQRRRLEPHRRHLESPMAQEARRRIVHALLLLTIRRDECAATRQRLEVHDRAGTAAVRRHALWECRHRARAEVQAGERVHDLIGVQGQARV